ncbi:hypothetical protein L873DRAFT_634934 [Choiromyces venosus 120613-1]|uniref:Uncharacterized protein n=1 Tax=Choiromyces venosus 120613-1 TaxID=1336337 RepID=A0A3N4JTT5_9PEZI|nr:hypothetical protein L873DRAFT_634934 [Choiromyces venosus 120613-1]
MIYVQRVHLYRTVLHRSIIPGESREEIGNENPCQKGKKEIYKRRLYIIGRDLFRKKNDHQNKSAGEQIPLCPPAFTLAARKETQKPSLDHVSRYSGSAEGYMSTYQWDIRSINEGMKDSEVFLIVVTWRACKEREGKGGEDGEASKNRASYSPERLTKSGQGRRRNST